MHLITRTVIYIFVALQTYGVCVQPVFHLVPLIIYGVVLVSIYQMRKQLKEVQSEAQGHKRHSQKGSNRGLKTVAWLKMPSLTVCTHVCLPMCVSAPR